MLLFFRSNQIFVAFLLALYAVMLHSGALLGHIQAPLDAATSGLLYQSWFGWAAGHAFLSALTATFLVVIQGISVNLLADEFRLMGDRNWFPGLFYVLYASAFPEFLFLSAPLVAVTFIPFSLWRIFNAYQKPNVSGAIFDGALWIGVSSLFYPPALWLLAAAFGACSIVRVFRLKERFVFGVGIFVPLFLCWLGYFWADRGSAFREIQWGNLFEIFRFGQGSDTVSIIKTAFALGFALILLFGIGSIYSRKGIQAQKFASVLYWFLLAGALSVFLQSTWRWEHLLLPASSVGILLALSFQPMKNRMWAELSHLTILLLVFFIQYAGFFLQLLDTNL